MKMNDQTYMLTDSGNTVKLSYGLGFIGVALCLVGYFNNYEQFIHSYLVAFVFWMTIVLGALFFTLMHHLTGAVWSVVLRNVVDAIIATIPLMAVLWIPLGFGLHDTYHWSHESAVANDHLLQLKAPYLNTTFFVIRTVGYFLIWTFLSRKLLSISRSAGTQADLDKMRRVSAWGTILFALTFSFAMFDWLMSLEPHWFSTIYGVYLFGGSYLSALAFMTVVLVYLNKKNILKKEVTDEHYQDLGKLIFAFTIFWAYIAGSQYFLIWFGNIPEETIWYLYRWEGSWKIVSLVLMVGGFVVPFIVLMTRQGKRNIAILSTIAVWVIVFHWLDIYWNVIPTFYKGNAHFSWMDITTLMAIGGLFMGLFWSSLSKHPLIPVDDPRIKQSIAFKNF